MLARDLVELAALAAAHGPAVALGPGRLPAASLENYWSASKARQERWNRALKDSAAAEEEDDVRPTAQPTLLRPLLEEIFVAEILTRIWSGVLISYDRLRASGDAEPVARSVLSGHVEVRHRALKLLMRETQLDVEDAVAVNRLRRRCERWTDVLLGSLPLDLPLAELAFDAERARDFADDLRHQRSRPGGRYAWPLTLVSLRAAFKPAVGAGSPNGDANARVASSILACFPADVFDSTGMVRSLWLLRMASVTSDAQGMIADLLAPERPNDGHLHALPEGGRILPWGEIS